MNQPLISVIVPIYNVEKYLNQCIDSIVNQTYRNQEIILVDDGSPDNCPQMCDDWAKKDNRIKVIHKSNGGLSDARNFGLENATGEYVTFVDSDDWLELDGIEKLVNPLKKKDYDIVIGGFYYNSSNSETSKYSKDNTESTVFKTIERMLSGTEINHSSSSKLYRLKLFNNIKYPLGKYYEDNLTIFKVVNNSNLIYLIDTPIYHYRKHSDSITQSTKNLTNKMNDFFDAIYDTHCFLINRYPSLQKYITAFSLKHSLTILDLLKENKSKDIYLKTKNWINSFTIKNIIKSNIPFQLVIKILLFRLNESLYFKLINILKYYKNTK